MPDLPDLRTDGQRGAREAAPTDGIDRRVGGPADPPVDRPVVPGGTGSADAAGDADAAGGGHAGRDRDAELAAEQAHVDAAYAALDEMRRSAERVAEAYAEVRRGGTHQARLERDIAHDTTRRRLAALDIGSAPLVFGRLDRDDGARFHVGRIGVDDEGHDPLVVDWRAPVAEAFYRATAVEPMGVVRRRHFATRGGREIVGLDDEIFDRGQAEESGLAVVGEGALLAALERQRTGRMGDIVATIQVEQDRAIRADLAGTLIVTGGPGTGKTAVALHRAAYLLYTHRERLRSQGVLLVGPGRLFLRYIEQVLPSLGEHDVQLATLPGLKPRLVLTGDEPEAVAVVKGDARMARVLERALADRERPLPRDVAFTLDRIRLRISRRDTARIVERARSRRGSHNSRRPFVVQMLLDLLVGRYRRGLVDAYRAAPLFDPGDAADAVDPTIAAALARGEAPPEGWEAELRVRLRRVPEVRAALERMWPVLTGAELVHDLFSFTALVRSAADGLLTRDEQRGLRRPRSASVREVPWTVADVALVDEADALLGPPDEARVRRRRGRDDEALATAAAVIEELGMSETITAAALAERFAEPVAADPRSAGELRTYGHVVVDEAQDLSAMQWRMLARRVPSASMTVVGDFGQATRPGAPAGWDDVVAHLPRHHDARFVTLSVNYRTPSEIMDVASRLLAVAAPEVPASRSVRSTGEAPCFVAVDRAGVDGAVGDAAAAALRRGGTVAVIGPEGRQRGLAAALASLGAVADSPDALDAPVAVLTGADAKGLEFDHVVVVEPAELVPPGARGLRMLYVILTRATRSLTVVHARPLPEALAVG